MSVYFQKTGLALAALAIAALPMAGPAAAVDPVIHYTFDDGTLTNSGSGGATYNGAIYQTVQTVGGTPGGSVAYVAGPSGALALDVTNTQGSNYGTFLGVQYAMPEQGTLAMWYQVGNPGFYSYEPVFDMVEAIAPEGTTNTYDANAWEAWIYSAGHLRGRLGYTSTGLQPANYYYAFDADMSAVGAPNGDWCHLAITWDKNDTSGENLKLYVDGKLSSVANLSWTAPGAYLCFGGGNTGNDTATGAYDDIRVYDSVISGSEVAALAGASPDVIVPTPKIHYAFEGNLNNGGSLGAANNGIHVDGSAGALSYTAGVVGQGVSYDNVKDTMINGDYVSSGYTLTNAGAISVWYKPEESFDWNSVWDNSVSAGDWEGWIYSPTSSTPNALRARLKNTTSNQITSRALSEIYASTHGGSTTGWENEWYHFVYTWDKTANTISLYVNGKLVENALIGSNWVNPGTFFLGGGNDGNEYAVGVFDELMLFDQHLTSAQAKALYEIPEPGTLVLLISALALCGLRRKATA